MRTLLFIALLSLSSMALASGPKYNYADPKLDDEVNNIYFDIKNVANGKYNASSMTLLGMTVSSLTVSNQLTLGSHSILNAAGYVKGTYLQLGSNVTSNTTTKYTANSTTLVHATNLDTVITPLSATSVIKITAQLSAFINAPAGTGSDMDVQLVRNPSGSNTNLGIYNEVLSWNAAAAAQVYSVVTLTWYDTPNTTSATTYAINIRDTVGATSTCSINDLSIAAPTSYVRIDEIAQ